MQTDQIRDNLLDFLVRNFVVERQDIDLDKSLVDEGVIDSLGLIEISAHLEKTHAITIEPSDMSRQNFGSVTRIVEFVARKLAKTAS